LIDKAVWSQAKSIVFLFREDMSRLRSKAILQHLSKFTSGILKHVSPAQERNQKLSEFDQKMAELNQIARVPWDMV
jgi:hypothetical protein